MSDRTYLDLRKCLDVMGTTGTLLSHLKLGVPKLVSSSSIELKRALIQAFVNRRPKMLKRLIQMRHTRVLTTRR